MDNYQFFIKLKQHITSIFNEIENKEDLFEFGIFADQDISTILIGYNTYSYFADQLKKYFLEENKIVSQYRWLILEWYKEINYGNIFLDEINDMLYNVIQPKEAKTNPENFKYNILDLLFNALFELRDEGVFNSMRANSILYVEQADSSIGDFKKQRIRKLIGEKYYEEFLYDQRHEIIE